MFEQLPQNESAKAMKEEMIRDLEEKVDDLIESGKSEEDAVNKVIVDFGDIREIKKEFDLSETGDRRKRELAKLNLGFSICGSALIILLAVFINFYYTPDVIWFIYPTFAVAWWPLAMFYNWYRKKAGE